MYLPDQCCSAMKMLLMMNGPRYECCTYLECICKIKVLKKQYFRSDSILYVVLAAMNIVKTTERHLVAEYVNINVCQSGSISKTI